MALTGILNQTMPSSTTKNEFAEYVVELMQTIGPVYSKRMFGGYGIFLDGLMFALIADNTLYLKVDKESQHDFEQKGMEAFTYYKKGKPCSMSYFQAPEETIEHADEMNTWANKAYSAAVRAAHSKSSKTKKR